jgi:hypothetical protein
MKLAWMYSESVNNKGRDASHFPDFARAHAVISGAIQPRRVTAECSALNNTAALVRCVRAVSLQRRSALKQVTLLACAATDTIASH